MWIGWAGDENRWEAERTCAYAGDEEDENEWEGGFWTYLPESTHVAFNIPGYTAVFFFRICQEVSNGKKKGNKEIQLNE